MLSDIGIGNVNLQRQVDAVIKFGLLIGNSVSNIGQKVITLIANFDVRTKQVIMERALVIPRALPVNRQGYQWSMRSETNMVLFRQTIWR